MKGECGLRAHIRIRGIAAQRILPRPRGTDEIVALGERKGELFGDGGLGARAWFERRQHARRIGGLGTFAQRTREQNSELKAIAIGGNGAARCVDRSLGGVLARKR